MTKARKILIVVLALVLMIILALQVLTKVTGYGLDFSELSYWVLFILLVVLSPLSLFEKLALPLGLAFYSFGSFLFVITLRELSEVFFKVSILFFLVGIVRAALQFKRKVEG